MSDAELICVQGVACFTPEQVRQNIVGKIGDLYSMACRGEFSRIDDCLKLNTLQAFTEAYADYQRSIEDGQSINGSSKGA